MIVDTVVHMAVNTVVDTVVDTVVSCLGAHHQHLDYYAAIAYW